MLTSIFRYVNASYIRPNSLFRGTFVLFPASVSCAHSQDRHQRPFVFRSSDEPAWQEPLSRRRLEECQAGGQLNGNPNRWLFWAFRAVETGTAMVIL